MAAITVTPANVRAGSGAKIEHGIAGATITAGQAVYKDAADNKYKLARANGTAAEAAVVGLALNNSFDNNPISIVLEDDDFTPGATLSLSAAADDGIYVLGSTAGAINPVGDIASGWRPVIIGVAVSASKMMLRFVRGTAQLTA